MIKEVVNFVNRFFPEEQKNYPELNEVILKSVLVYQYLYLQHFNEIITIDRVLKLNNGEIGLIGPGNGCTTHFLERVLGWSHICHEHSIIHDAFGRFYLRYGKGRGYTYLYENAPKWMKRSPLAGQVCGLDYWIWHRKDMKFNR